MMTAFIIAVRGTVAEAGLLGLAATVSHASVVWVVGLIGMHFAANRVAPLRNPFSRWHRPS